METLLQEILSQKENLERILESLSEGVIAHDVARRILYFNRSAEQITGYDRNDVLGRDCHEVFGGAFCGGRCSFREGTPDSLDRLSYPLPILTKQGDSRRVEMELAGMKDKEGRFVGVIAAFRDVTDLLGLRIEVGDLKGFAGIVGQDLKMLRIYRQIRDLATNDYPVHIAGETGTGKELVANAIHNESRRGGKPFVPVNCGALPEGILESELFGHVKGAFTGAIRDKKGRFELAHGGTLFLDEVADLPRPFQARLLRVLQEGSFERVGDEKTVSVDVRVISATNKELRQEVSRGYFREDLYYRINVVPVVLPPLRERQGDIPLLVEHVLKRACEEGQETPGVSGEALSLMEKYPWPGNIRELQSAIRFSLVQARGKVIQPDHLPAELREQCRLNPHPRFSGLKLSPETVHNALVRTGGNKKKAASLLGVGRATLYRFLGANPGVS
ncbi:MAG: sigma 54-interacting transcriptional regulator [Deltaproteobacteria bacterium]|nr:sigma 54-interacting transcriptional regulator [Deltaproteobacteria bacterium]